MRPRDPGLEAAVAEVQSELLQQHNLSLEPDDPLLLQFAAFAALARSAEQGREAFQAALVDTMTEKIEEAVLRVERSKDRLGEHVIDRTLAAMRPYIQKETALTRQKALAVIDREATGRERELRLLSWFSCAFLAILAAAHVWQLVAS